MMKTKRANNETGKICLVWAASRGTGGGHRETKRTALQMNEELDAGPGYLKEHLSLDARQKRFSCGLLNCLG